MLPAALSRDGAQRFPAIDAIHAHAIEGAR